MRSHFIIGAVGMAGVVLSGGCGSGGPGPRDADGPAWVSPGEMRGVPAAAGTPVLVMNGESIGWESLVAPLAEAGGAPVVEELVLTAGLRREFLKRDWTLTSADLEAERRAYEENLAAQGGAGGAASAIVDGVRRARGLGPARFAALIERNAMLRRLVKEEVTVTGEEVALATGVRYGPKVRARLIVLGDERAAGEVRGRLADAAGAELVERFAAEARRQSIDPSGPSGGVNEPVSPSDPSLPVAMRRALAETPVGSVSPVVALDGTWAVVLVEERVDGSAIDPAAVRESMEREVRLRKERIAMEEVARRMVESAAVTVFDPSLRYGWESRRRR